MMKPSTYAIKIVEDMWSNPYNNYMDMRIMKRSVNQVETKAATYDLGQKIQALSKQIESLTKAQSQLPNSTPLYHTCERCGCVHGPGECTLAGKLAQVIMPLIK